MIDIQGLDLVAVNNPHTINITVPVTLEGVLRDATSDYELEEYGTDEQDNGVQTFHASIDTNGNEIDLQTKLLKMQLPFVLEIVGEHDRDQAFLYAMYDEAGVYAHKAVEPADTYTDIRTLLDWLVNGELEQKVHGLGAQCRPWTFSQADFDQCKRLQLAFIVKPE